MKARGSETTVPKIGLIWDSTQVQSKIHFMPKRGPGKITWPLAAKKALIELTGRKTLNKALDAYESFFRARRATITRMRPWGSGRIREYAMDGPWTKDFFRSEAEDYLNYPRKGFQVGKQKERISKLLSRLGLK